MIPHLPYGQHTGSVWLDGSFGVDRQFQEREGDGKVLCQTLHHGHHAAAVSKMEMVQTNRGRWGFLDVELDGLDAVIEAMPSPRQNNLAR